MPAVVRLGDLCTGHGCYPARPNIEASDTVFVNGLGAHRVDDAWAIHCCGDCHDGLQETGSSTVYVNHKPVARIGDKITCGSYNATGSPNVFAN
jgi:uncharacterized Zn-binding protein involved in type VI secretion